MEEEINDSTAAGSYHPHFFQPLLPGFRRRFSIPKYFMKTYLVNELISKKRRRKAVPVFERKRPTLTVVLRSQSREWVVQLRGRILEKGWAIFISQYYDRDDFDEYGHSKKMDVGDILVFRHMGKLVFDVFVFDPSTSFQKVPAYHSKDTDDAKSSHANSRNFKKKKKITTMISPEEEQCSKPYFDTVMKKDTNLRKSSLYLPKAFIDKIGFGGSELKCVLMILQDDRGRRWDVEARFYSTRPHVYITTGWKAFRIGNGLRQGDCFRLSLLKNGRKPVLLFSRRPKKIGLKRRRKTGFN